MKRLAIRASMASGNLENSGTPRNDSAGNETVPSVGDIDPDPLGLRQLHLGAIDAIGSALDLHPRQQPQEPRGVIDIIFGEVFVVWARFLATDVVTLRCNRLSDTGVPSLTRRCDPAIHETPVEVRTMLASTNWSRSL